MDVTLNLSSLAKHFSDEDAARELLEQMRWNGHPTCPHCGGMARPNVMMFNDWEWLEQREKQQAAHMENWLSSMSRPVVVEIGAGSAIPSVRHFSEQLIGEMDARLVRINVRECEVPSGRDVGLGMGALEALRRIDCE